MSDDDPDRMPIWAFAVVFLASPLLMAAVVVFARYRHELASSRLATPLVVGHLVCGLGFLGVWIWRKRQGVS